MSSMDYISLLVVLRMPLGPQFAMLPFLADICTRLMSLSMTFEPPFFLRTESWSTIPKKEMQIVTLTFQLVEGYRKLNFNG